MSLSLTPPRFLFSFSETLRNIHPKYFNANIILDDGMEMQIGYVTRAVAHPNPWGDCAKSPSAVDGPLSFAKDVWPPIVSFSPCMWGDIFSSFSLDEQRENRGGETLTAVDCYMKQHGVSKEETLYKFLELSDEGWKDLNTGWLEKTSTPKDIIEMVLNYARHGSVTYKNCEDSFTFPEKYFVPLIVAQFLNPIII